MEFPFGHHNRRNNHRDDEESEEYPNPEYPPPPSYGGAYPHAPPQPYPPPPSYGGDYPPPPPQVAGVYHISHNTPEFDSPDYPPPPPQQPPYEHHEYGSHQESGGSHGFRPHMPGFMEGYFRHSTPSHVSHESSDLGEGGGLNMENLEGYFGNKQSCRIYCKASETTYCVAIRENKVVLTYADPDDITQHWYKDEKYSTKVKDEDGYPSFSLVNKATGQAMKHPVSGQPVDLIPYNPDHLDASVLWTESKDLGSGYRTIRNVNNVKMVLDAFNGDKDHGGVHDGTFLSIFKCWKGDNRNQQWKIFSY